MSHITVSDEQAKAIAESPEQIEIRDRSGKHLGYVAHGFSQDEIDLAKQRRASGEPRSSTQEMLDRIQSLGQK